jgi:hypothetical protein
MITAKHLTELLNFKTPSPAVVSLYLDSFIDRGHLGTMRRLLQRAAEGASAHPHLQEDLSRIADFVESEYEADGNRALAIFSAKRFGLWRVCRLPQSVKPQIRVAEKPYLAPLLSMTDQHLRFGAVLAGPGGARFLEVFMGAAQEYPDLAIPAPDPARQHDFLKEVSDKLDGLARNQGFQRIVVGVAADLSSKLVSHLHSSIEHNLILDPDLDPTATAQATLARIAACESQARQVRETVLVHRLVDAARGGKGLAVLGLERTLDALQKGQVRLLMARDGWAKMGRRCPQCGRLSISWTKCVDCGRSTETVFNLVEEMVDRALESNCEVFRLLHETPLDNLGRIGAELTCDPPENAPAPAAKNRKERMSVR